MTNPADLADEREREKEESLKVNQRQIQFGRQEEATSYQERQHGYQCWIERMTRNLKDDLDCQLSLTSLTSLIRENESTTSVMSEQSKNLLEIKFAVLQKEEKSGFIE